MDDDVPEYSSFDEMIEAFEEAHGVYMGHYDMEGERVSADEWWQRRMEDPSYKRVAWTEVGDYEVSTVLLGIDHGMDPSKPPLIFETMIFDADRHGVWTDRYSNKVAALAGHDQAVAMAKAGDVPKYEDEGEA